MADRAVLRVLSNCARRLLSLQSEVLSVYSSSVFQQHQGIMGMQERQAFNGFLKLVNLVTDCCILCHAVPLKTGEPRSVISIFSTLTKRLKTDEVVNPVKSSMITLHLSVLS